MPNTLTVEEALPKSNWAPFSWTKELAKAAPVHLTIFPPVKLLDPETLRVLLSFSKPVPAKSPTFTATVLATVPSYPLAKVILFPADNVFPATNEADIAPLPLNASPLPSLTPIALAAKPLISPEAADKPFVVSTKDPELTWTWVAVTVILLPAPTARVLVPVPKPAPANDDESTAATNAAEPLNEPPVKPDPKVKAAKVGVIAPEPVIANSPVLNLVNTLKVPKPVEGIEALANIFPLAEIIPWVERSRNIVTHP